MTQQGNILSFDEARKTVRGSRSSAVASNSASNKFANKKPNKRNSSKVTATASATRSQPANAQASKNSKALKMSKFSEFKRGLTKSKAGKEFTKQFGDTTASAASTGPRAALYKGEMGRQHKKSAHMQQSSLQNSMAIKRFSFSFDWKNSSKVLATFMVTACLILSGAFLYPAAKQYYVTLRQHDQLVAEYEAVQQRNNDIQSQVDALSTPEGIEDRARAEFGWVKQGEHAVNVYGLENSQQEEAGYVSTVPAGSVEAPVTWYSPWLDFLFGIE